MVYRQPEYNRAFRCLGGACPDTCCRDWEIVVDEGDNRLFAELSRDFGYDTGITVCGAYDENDEFQAEYCFPFFRGTGITSGEDVVVERHAEKESFAGACDDVRIGVTLIFYLQNAGEYLDAKYKGALDGSRTTLTLSGLSVEGKVLLPVQKDLKQAEKILNEDHYGLEKVKERILEYLAVRTLTKPVREMRRPWKVSPWRIWILTP